MKCCTAGADRLPRDCKKTKTEPSSRRDWLVTSRLQRNRLTDREGAMVPISPWDIRPGRIYLFYCSLSSLFVRRFYHLSNKQPDSWTDNTWTEREVHRHRVYRRLKVSLWRSNFVVFFLFFEDHRKWVHRIRFPNTFHRLPVCSVQRSNFPGLEITHARKYC